MCIRDSYVGDRLLSQREWEYDAAKRALHFKTSSVSGYFEMERNAQESQGMLSCGGEAFAASIVVAPITYELSVAKGAAYVSTAGVRPVLVYSEDSPEWKSAWEDVYKRQAGDRAAVRGSYQSWAARRGSFER